MIGNFLPYPDTGKYPCEISLGWHEKEGFNKLGWWGYTEALFLYVIAAGMDMPNAVKGYESWLKTYQWREPYKGLGTCCFPRNVCSSIFNDVFEFERNAGSIYDVIKELTILKIQGEQLMSKDSMQLIIQITGKVMIR